MSESEKLNEPAKKVANVASKAKESVKSAASAVSGQAADIAGRAAEAVSNANAYVRDQYDHLGGSARHAYEQARETGRTWIHETEGYIHRRPITALTIAVGVGFLAGVYIKRR